MRSGKPRKAARFRDSSVALTKQCEGGQTYSIKLDLLCNGEKVRYAGTPDLAFALTADNVSGIAMTAWLAVSFGP